MRKLTIPAIGLVSLIVLSGCTSKQTIDDKFNGLYKLDKFESYDSISGKWKADKFHGKDYEGYIQYDGKGHMSVHLYPKEYKTFDTNKNIDTINQESLRELTKFYQSNFVYFANYKIVNDSTIEHHRVSATEPKNFGTTLTRNFEFKGDTLILSANEKLDEKRMRLRWVKL